MINGYAIALAWPEQLCKKPGSWYDGLMTHIGICTNSFYPVGHVAIILIQSQTGDCHYFDFGRYHAPVGYGRVRDEKTDHELKIVTKASISGKENIINNFNKILNEIICNPANNEKGAIHASYCPINYESAFYKAKSLQKISPLKYGPFIWNGTNCTRFVRRILIEGIAQLNFKLKIQFPFSITPTPMGIVNSLSNKFVLDLKLTKEYEKH